MALTSKLTAAYIAGLVDGDGSITIGRKLGWYYTHLFIGNTNKEIIEWLEKSFGGKTYHISHEGTNTKDMYYWFFRRKDGLIPFIKKVQPYLKIKKRNAEILIQFSSTFQKKFYDYERRPNGQILKRTVVPHIAETRLRLWREIKTLNHRGRHVHAERLSEKNPTGYAIV